MAFLSEDIFFEVVKFTLWGMPTFNFNLSKIKLRTEVSTEPTHFITLMNNGKAFSSSDQFQFLPRHWQAKLLDFLRP